MNRYSSYKDSGEKWLGDIPSHWKMERWRFLLSENKEKNSSLKEKTQLQFFYGEIVEKPNQSEDKEVLDTIKNYTVVKPGDIMINGLNLNYDFVSQRVARVKEEGVITSAYISIRNTEIANSKYYNYLLKALDAKKMFHGMGTGIRLTLSYKELKNQFLPCPSLEEQQAIASYLDSATSKIDAAIAREQKMIDLLNERKQIIINHAVTKGLNPNLKMRESGVEWISEIPVGWEILPLKSICKLGKGLQITKADLVEEGLPVVSYGQIHAKYNTRTHLSKNLIRYVPTSYAKGNDSCKVNSNEFVVADTSEDLEGCGNMVFNDSDKKIYAGYHTVIIKSLKYDYPKYLAYLFTSQVWRKQIRSLVNGVKVYSITQSILKRTDILRPSADEQKAIIAYLDKKTKVIDATIKERINMIALLHERKQIIINDVVTGKIKVD